MIVIYFLRQQEHCEIFARTIREVCGTDFFDTHSAQMNGALALKHLVRKGIIEDAIRRQLVQKCIAERNQQQEDLRKSMDFDKNPAVLQTAMKISVFTGLRLMDEDAALVCNQSYPLVVHGPLDLRQNRMFLGCRQILSYFVSKNYDPIFVSSYIKS